MDISGGNSSRFISVAWDDEKNEEKDVTDEDSNLTLE